MFRVYVSGVDDDADDEMRSEELPFAKYEILPASKLEPKTKLL